MSTVKSFTDIQFVHTMENSFGGTSDHTNSISVLTDSTSRIVTDLNEIIHEFNDKFRNNLDYDSIMNEIKKYSYYSKHLGHIEIEIIMVEVCKKD